jgi:hypothetical protein
VLYVMHAEVNSCMGGHRRVSLHVHMACRLLLLLTVEDTYQVDFESPELGCNRPAIRHGQGSSTDANGTFGDSSVWDLEQCVEYAHGR